MALPRWLARFNRSVTNRILGSLPRRISPFVTVHHVGRATGRSYEVPLAAFETPFGVVFTPTYGPDADWVKNLLAAESFEIDRRGTIRTFTGARLVDRSEAFPHLPRLVRLAMRVLRIDRYVVADRLDIADG